MTARRIKCSRCGKERLPRHFSRGELRCHWCKKAALREAERNEVADDEASPPTPASEHEQNAMDAIRREAADLASSYADRGIEGVIVLRLAADQVDRGITRQGT